MSALPAALVRSLQAGTNSVVTVFLCLVSFSVSVYAHGGGLDANGCHTNRKTGDYHCHRGGSANLVAPDVSRAPPTRATNTLAAPRTTGSGQTCYTGPRGGTYTITASGRKNYGGC
ncbi:YHYH domain-containing protein [Cupriavidus oxalaticus]|uniref:YHYH domain-containing protein n=1 Tax=Cupriavidus oxalaticus TaxID=96344 RepID=A0A5P3VDX7_9BURK|nr:YHYH domain-containing protein [Cupriavidus oxalaticus]QEZ44148.1 YHYH domain-containing protein [Cupriavidus oxalaticus]